MWFRLGLDLIEKKVIKSWNAEMVKKEYSYPLEAGICLDQLEHICINTIIINI